MRACVCVSMCELASHPLLPPALRAAAHAATSQRSVNPHHTRGWMSMGLRPCVLGMVFLLVELFSNASIRCNAFTTHRMLWLQSE